MPHSPVTKVIYPPLDQEGLKKYRKDMYEYERRFDEQDDVKYLPEELLSVAWILLKHAEFLEYKLEAKTKGLKRELQERAREYDKLKSEYDAYKSNMAEEHLSSVNATPETEKNDPKNQKR
ncbi:hypothetical protein MMC07_005315 [Pseudocyphellaria aurata]|nr:hypothetical protein [Pseudocyphellaria aurata]